MWLLDFYFYYIIWGKIEFRKVHHDFQSVKFVGYAFLLAETIS